MPRPCVKAERTTEILDAFERCVARFGVEGSTLDRIANEAGLARSLLRHHVGNRAALLDALVDRFLAQSKSEITQMFADLPSEDRIETLLDWLFGEGFSNAQTVRVSEALISAAEDDGALAAQLRRWIESYRWALSVEFERGYPDAEPGACANVAAGIVGISFNVESLVALGQMAEFRAASKQAARRLVASLERPR